MTQTMIDGVKYDLLKGVVGVVKYSFEKDGAGVVAFIWGCEKTPACPGPQRTPVDGTSKFWRSSSGGDGAFLKCRHCDRESLAMLADVRYIREDGSPVAAKDVGEHVDFTPPAAPRTWGVDIPAVKALLKKYAHSIFAREGVMLKRVADKFDALGAVMVTEDVAGSSNTVKIVSCRPKRPAVEVQPIEFSEAHAKRIKERDEVREKFDKRFHRRVMVLPEELSQTIPVSAAMAVAHSLAKRIDDEIMSGAGVGIVATKVGGECPPLGGWEPKSSPDCRCSLIPRANFKEETYGWRPVPLHDIHRKFALTRRRLTNVGGGDLTTVVDYMSRDLEPRESLGMTVACVVSPDEAWDSPQAALRAVRAWTKRSRDNMERRLERAATMTQSDLSGAKRTYYAHQTGRHPSSASCVVS